MEEVGDVAAQHWQACFERVFFPMIERMMQPLQGTSAQDRQVVQELRVRFFSLIAKLFMHHVHKLKALPKFVSLWLKLLKVYECFVKSGEGEHVTELLKNMLLVMLDRTYFEQRRRVLRLSCGTSPGQLLINSIKTCSRR